MKKVDVLLGLQWGDEGKGKIVDVLTPNYDIIMHVFKVNLMRVIRLNLKVSNMFCIPFLLESSVKVF